MKSSKVCITTKSTLASLLFKGLATKHTTVKWSILNYVLTIAKIPMFYPKGLNRKFS